MTALVTRFQSSCLCIAFLGNAWLLHAQPMRFENYSTKTGLSQNTGYCITQTHDGFMWLGTQGGLNRFDGHRIKVYQNKEGGLNSLCNNFIKSLLTDGADTLWVGTPEGISIYQPCTDKFYRPSVFFSMSSGLDRLQVTALKKDGQGNVWILTIKDGLFCFDKKGRSIRRFFEDPETAACLEQLVLTEQGELAVLTGKDIHVFDGSYFHALGLPAIAGPDFAGSGLKDAVFTHGELWVGTTREGIYRIGLLPARKMIAHITRGSPEWALSQNEIRCLIADREGNVWIGTTNDGVFHYDYATRKVRNGRYDRKDPNSLHYNYTHSLFEDRQGIIWIGLSYGIAKYDAGKNFFQNILLPDRKDGDAISDNMILGLWPDQDGRFYVGTLAGGMAITDRNFKQFQFLAHEIGNVRSLIHNEVYSFTRDAEGQIWIATFGGLCRYNPLLPPSKAFTAFAYGDLERHINFNSLLLLRHENALLVGGDNAFFKFDLNTHKWIPLPDPMGFTDRHTFGIKYMQEDTAMLTGVSRQVWLCTRGEGLLAYNYGSGIFTEYPEIRRLSPVVKHLQLVRDTLWLATDNGLVMAKAGNRQYVRRYGSNKGLTGDMVYAVQADQKGNIWLSTNYGISRFNKGKADFTNYGVGYGISGTEFNTAVACKDEQGYLYFGGVNGITRFLPEAIVPSAFSPPVLITEVQVMNKPLTSEYNISYTPGIRLSHKRNFITIHFVAPNYLQSENITYYYKLEGVNKEWQNAGTLNFASYTDLLPGQYTFKVKAANNDGIWSKEITELDIVIVPPFWQTWWFYSVMLLALAGLGWLLLRLRIRYIRKEAQVNTQLAEMEMKALHAQMNPHFIFNCLGSIKQMIMEEERDNASHYLTKFARLIRLSLVHSQQALITLNENNEYLRHYLLMEQLRFNDSFQYTIEVAEGINGDELVFPPMMIQPLVENGIWHGLLGKEGCQLLSIRYSISPAALVCEIEDNGIGIDHVADPGPEHKSVGIDNIRKRLALLNMKYKMNCSLYILDKKNLGDAGQGTLVVLTLPIINQFE